MIQEEIFTKALGLVEPWYVERIVFNEEIGQFDFYIAFRNHQSLTNDVQSYYDTKERVWRHLDVMQYKLFIHCKIPRIRTKEGHIKQIEVPWARRGTLLTFPIQLRENRRILLIKTDIKY